MAFMDLLHQIPPVKLFMLLWQIDLCRVLGLAACHRDRGQGKDDCKNDGWRFGFHVIYPS
jgi:hypothetical protein